MRTCHRTFLSGTLLLFIALAVMPASAFYNPNTGRWLNRDPIGDAADRNEYTATRNNPISSIDRLGLLTCATTVTTVPKKVLMDAHPEVLEPDRLGGDTTVTPNFVPGHDQPCKVGCSKYVGYSFSCTARIRISEEARDIAAIEAHEREHLHNAERAYTEDDEFFKGILDKCVPNKCYNANIREGNALVPYEDKSIAYDNALLDAAEWHGPDQERFQNLAIQIYPQWLSLYDAWFAAHLAKLRACNGQ